MRRFAILFLILIGLPAAILLYGMVEAGKAMDDDPLTETDPVRLEYRDKKYAECIGDLTAKPDEIYCGAMADQTIAYYTTTGMLQEFASFGTHGLIPRPFHEPTELEEMEARVKAESYAKRKGADGSARFTGAKLAEYEAKLDKLYETSDVFYSKAQRCDPDGELMKSIMEASPGRSAEDLHRGMDCEGWDK